LNKRNGQAVPLEATIVSAIIKALKAQGIFVVKTHGGAFQMAGLPDLILIAPVTGRFVGIEVKRPVLGVVTELQKAILRKINQAGGYGCVAYSVVESLEFVKKADAGEQAPSND
jgi:hypothetical protein